MRCAGYRLQRIKAERRVARRVVCWSVFFGKSLKFSADWQLQSKTDAEITLATGEVGNSFIASVMMFRLPPAATPAAFESLIIEGAARDRDPHHSDRYELLDQYVAYSSERPYPCVRYRALLRDNFAKGTRSHSFLSSTGSTVAIQWIQLREQ